jgi:hypothetical protein
MFMKEKHNSMLLYVVLAVVFMVVAAAAVWYVWGGDSGEMGADNSPLTQEQIDEGLEMAEDLILNHEKYEELEGGELEFKGLDSDAGDLSCIDCDGAAYSFVSGDGTEYLVSVGFTATVLGSVDINYADLHEVGDDSYYYDLLTSTEVPTDTPIGPEDAATPPL